jgi:hypothetical protein
MRPQGAAQRAHDLCRRVIDVLAEKAARGIESQDVSAGRLTRVNAL